MPNRSDRFAAVLTLAFILFFLLVLTLGLARGHGTHVENDDPCTIVYEYKTQNGTIMQWCDLNGDGEAELFQEIIFSDGEWHYLNMGAL